ncbi:hypothetical protein [Paenibacillus elgii]|uniref:hypothetical protein n=1 Tax=Paenibacillus elgii TaxID=189691 RepID=UPI000248D580|nr:hypothetical protein [Paenibacillus elgii]
MMTSIKLFSSKKMTYTLLILLIIAILVYWFLIFNSVREINVHADAVTFSDVDSLDKAAEVVLIGTPIKNFFDREHSVSKRSDGTISSFATSVEVSVESVIKKPSDLQIDKGSIFKFNEPVGLIQEISGKVKLNVDDYRELEKGNKYIVFLSKHPISGEYFVFNYNLGNFKLSSNEKTFSGNASEDSKKEAFKKEVLSKYGL